jgi:hypothetical protein
MREHRATISALPRPPLMGEVLARAPGHAALPKTLTGLKPISDGIGSNT